MVVFTKEWCFSLEPQKVIRNFGYFLKKICHKDFSKIAQSGHTAVHLNVRRIVRIEVDGVDVASDFEEIRPTLESHRLNAKQTPISFPDWRGDHLAKLENKTNFVRVGFEFKYVALILDSF